MFLLWLLACAPDAQLVDDTRPTSSLFPSDDLLSAEGMADLSSFPVTDAPLAGAVIEGWASRLQQTAVAFGNHSAAYFRFDSPLEVPSTTEGDPTDDFLMMDLNSGELYPLDLRFYTGTEGDPFLEENTLAIAAQIGFPPMSGARLAAVVKRSAGVAAHDVAPEVITAFRDHSIPGKPAVATVFTVQDTVGQMQELFADADMRTHSSGDIEIRRVTSLSFTQGTTPSGSEGTKQTATYEDGSTRVAWLMPRDGDEGEHTVVFDDSWPMDIYELDIPTWNYSGLDDAPYMNPGFGHVGDVQRTSGWIDFTSAGLGSEPEVEMMRVVVAMPRTNDPAPVLIYDHGTAGNAYNCVQPASRLNPGNEFAAATANAGFAMVCRDAALYGTRYPLVDSGFTDGSLGFYNIVNLPAFRDNQRQTAVDSHVLRRFIEEELNDLLPEGQVAPERLRRFGHSMGSVTSHLALAADPDAYEAAFMSGTGGVFAHYFLDTGLLKTIDPSFIEALFGLFQVTDPPDPVTTGATLGAVLGIPREGWPNVDRLHPVVQLFQWTMDPSDPMAVARHETLPVDILLGVGDYQVPNFTTEALANALPDATIHRCEATWDYDPHQCVYREPEPGLQVFQTWLETEF